MNSVYIDGKGKRGKIIENEIRKYKIFEMVENPSDADGIIIATPPDTHYKRYLLFKDKPILMEKPMCISSADAYKMKKIMVGNNYMFSRTFEFFKVLLKTNKITITSITSNWFKNVDNKTDVAFDLAYHHIYIHYMLFDKMFKKIGIIDIDKKTKTLVLEFGNKKSIINVSHNNNYNFYRNDFVIETNKGTFYIKECDNILELYDTSGKKIYSSDTGLYNELCLFNKFIEGKYEYDNRIDQNIVKWVEK